MSGSGKFGSPGGARSASGRHRPGGGLVLGLAGGPDGRARRREHAGRRRSPRPTASAPSASASASASATASAAAVAEPATHCTYTTTGYRGGQESARAAGRAELQGGLYGGDQYQPRHDQYQLLNSKATCTVNSFVHLATAGYFNASQCHRVSDGAGFTCSSAATRTRRPARSCSCSPGAPGTGGPGYEFASENLPTGRPQEP